MAVTRRQFGVFASIAVAAASLAACTSSRNTADTATKAAAKTAAKHPAVATSPVKTPPPAPVPAQIALFPQNSASSVNPAVPVTVTAGDGTLAAVTLTSSDGASVPGQLSTDGTSWTASGQLGYKRTYTLSAEAVNVAGVKTTETAQFSTASPNNLTMPYLNTRGGAAMVDGATYGVGFVIRVHFDEEITNKAAAENALVVTTTPPVVGGWFWIDDTDALWRPEAYYPSGTKVTIDANLYGVEVGPGLYGQASKSASFTIGRKNFALADDTTHMVQVYWDDVLQRTMPTSMGKGGYITGSGGQQISFFTPSGTYTVLDQSNPVLMSSASYGLPINAPGGYSEYISWATRITTDGIYLHELDSTVPEQGHSDTSHGCLNLNHDNATWYYQNAQIGDVVQIVHTGGAPGAQWQNADWSLTWPQWQAGSALSA
jgi:lipoprotein-anchoring transpeptidase ErfK/SrfK